MTTVITRVFQDEASAKAAAKRVAFKGLPERAIEVVANGSTADLKTRMSKARVHESAIDTYADHVAQGRALLVVRATYKPLGAPRIAREELARRETVDVGEVMDDFFVSDPPEKATSILKDHPLFLTSRLTKFNRGLVSKGFGMPALSRKPRRKTASKTGRHMSRLFWPTPLLSTKQRRIKTMDGSRRMSRLFWPMPLLSKKARRPSVIKGGGTVFSDTLTWPTN